MNTLFLLMAEFSQADVSLEVVAKKYFNLDKKEAYARAKLRTLPVPAYRAIDSQKAPWLVSLTDLAAYLDKQRDHARAEWQRMNGRAA